MFSHSTGIMPSAEVDSFPMKCKECDIMQKTVKGLKMHIKLMHLRTGRFRCSRCEFSANIFNSIHTHYKIKHPEADQTTKGHHCERIAYDHSFTRRAIYEAIRGFRTCHSRIL